MKRGYLALVVLGVALVLATISAPPTLAGPCSEEHEAPTVYVPDRGCFALGVGYNYQHMNVLGTSFHTHDYDVNFTTHLFDAVTGAVGRLTVGVEANADAGFGGKAAGLPSTNVKSLFLGAGPHVAIQSASRFEPWAHGLVGLERLRFTQTSTLGANSTLGFIVGGGFDIHLAHRFAWRIEGDYVGTTYQSSIQSNYKAGTGIVLYF